MRNVLSIALALFIVSTTTAVAETYPSRPITIVVPFPAGGPTDALGRVLADRMKNALNAAQQKAEIEKWWPIIKAANIRAE